MSNIKISKIQEIIHTQKNAIISFIYCIFSVIFASISIIYSKKSLTTSVFWTRFFLLFFSSIFLLLSIFKISAQYSKTKKAYSFISLLLVIANSVFILITIFI